MANGKMKKAPVMRKTSATKEEHMKFDPRPSLHFSTKELPEIKDWKNGGKYSLSVEVEQISSDKEGARFRVIKVGNATK